MRRTVPAVLAVLAAACGVPNGQPPPPQMTQQAAVASSASQAITSVQQTVVAANALVDLNASHTDLAPGGVAGDVLTQSESQSAGCGHITFASSTVTADFGPPPGCTLKNGTVISGAASVGVTKTLQQVRFGLSFHQLVVNGKDLDGTTGFSLQEGKGYTADIDLTSGGAAIAGELTVKASPGQVQLDGAHHFQTAQTPPTLTDLAYQQVVTKFGDCYPSSGQVDATQGGVSVSIIFDAQTPATGKVTVKSGAIMWTQGLPSFGVCAGEL